MSRAFVQFCADLSAAPDRDAFDTTLAAVWRAAAGTTRAGWARAATDSLAPLLRSAPLPTATRIAGLCGAIVAAGGTPTPIAGPLLARGFDTLRLGRRFHDAWTGTGDDPAPNPEHQSPSPGLQARLEPRLGHETYLVGPRREDPRPSRRAPALTTMASSEAVRERSTVFSR